MLILTLVSMDLLLITLITLFLLIILTFSFSLQFLASFECLIQLEPEELADLDKLFPGDVLLGWELGSLFAIELIYSSDGISGGFGQGFPDLVKCHDCLIIWPGGVAVVVSYLRAWLSSDRVKFPIVAQNFFIDFLCFLLRAWPSSYLT